MGEVGRLNEEHHDLRSSLAELEAMIEPKSEAAVEPLAGRLAAFLGELEEHFAFEENGQLFAEIASQRPSFDREVSRLFRQHGEIQALFASARDLASSGKPVSEVAPTLRKAVKMLMGHERAEMDLLQEAELTDLGGGD
jgi:hypothetical protein